MKKENPQSAKFQTERMYSKEDMHEAFCAGNDFDTTSLKENTQYYRFKEWFNQYKNNGNL